MNGILHVPYISFDVVTTTYISLVYEPIKKLRMVFGEVCAAELANNAEG